MAAKRVAIVCGWLALLVSASLLVAGARPATAQGLEDHFQISYDPVAFDKTEVYGDETFHATVHGSATCSQDLPAPVKEARIDGRVVAQHVASGALVTLNAGYTVTIEPFPDEEGESTEIEQVVPLQFPGQSEPGEYQVRGELVSAKVKVFGLWVDVTEHLPQTEHMGSVSYWAEGPPPGATATPPPAPTPTPATTPGTTAPAQTPAPTVTTPPVQTPGATPPPSVPTGPQPGASLPGLSLLASVVGGQVLIAALVYISVRRWRARPR